MLLPFFWVLWGMIVFIYYSSFLEITLQSVHLINFENSSKIFLIFFALFSCFWNKFISLFIFFLQISYYLYFNVSPRKGRYRSLGSVCNLYVEDLVSFHFFFLCNHLFFNLFDIEINNVIIKNPLLFISCAYAMKLSFLCSFLPSKHYQYFSLPLFKIMASVVLIVVHSYVNM